MIAQVFQHVPFEDIGSIRGWLEQREAEIRYTRFFAGDNPPNVDSFDMLIVMGGPMSVTEEDRYPWLVGEKAVVRAALEAGKPVLGVCLGAQMMANALGAEIRKNPVPEIGWFPIRAVELGSEVFRFPAEISVFHWHGETFDLPNGALRLAQSDNCRNQAFQYGERALGLQFHLECNAESVSGMVDNCANELVAGVPSIQSAQEILAVTPPRYEVLTTLLYKMLDWLVDRRTTRMRKLLADTESGENRL